MKNTVLVLVVAFAFCTTAMAADIAFYVGAPNVDGWYDVTTQLADVETIIAETGHLFNDIRQFNDSQFVAFGAWVDENTDDGEMDIIWLNGCMPSCLYQFPNVNPDGSRAEKWLDGGNMIINVGDWFAYCSYEGGSRQADNAGSGAANILDLSSGIIVSADNTSLAVTPTGKEYLPSLNNSVISYRPIVLSVVVAPWEVAAVFAQNSAGTQADPVVIHNTDTDGYVAFINQSAGSGPPGWLDDRGLTCAEFIKNWVYDVVGLGANPYARSPVPKNGAMHTETWVTMSWSPGDFAVSHDVYMGENYDDVNNATHESETFRGNQGSPYVVAGFVGFPYPDGLIPGTTYYWRIDEVNDANASSPWKGNVWSFWIPPKKAYDPVPADGSKFVDSAKTTLKWTVGFGAKLHTVYFSDDYDTVANATGGTMQGTASFNPGVLEPDKTYFWRVDEFEAPNTHIGDVWSFKTSRIGGGLKGEYFNNTDLSGVPVLTRIDPQIDVYWNPGPVGPGVNEDNFSVRWTGELEAPFSEPFTFITGTDDGARMYLNGGLIINDWGSGHDYTEVRSQPTDLVAGEYYSIVVEGFELGGEAEWRLFWESPSMTRQLVPQGAMSPPIKASSPSPPSGATGTKMTPILRWGPGDYAVSHEVYFGTDADAVANATKSSPEYKGNKALGDESYDPGKLAWYTTYYWRIDEVNNLNPDSPWIGNLWSFTTGDFLVIDDFEDYDAGENQIWYSWIDGLGFGAPGTDPYNPGNGTGAAVGDEASPSYTEETIVHGGRQSMPLAYDNNKQGYSKYSETELKLTAPRDWTEEGVAELSLWFRGYPASTGSFVEGPTGTYTMTASGADIWLVNNVEADEFHFAYKMLSGAGSIIARVNSVQNTNAWAKAGVMIRESLNPDSAHAFACVTPGNGVASQYRPSTGGTSVNYNQTGVAAPYWVKLERSISGLFTVSHSANGTTWSPVTGAIAQNISMGANVYIGLALTSHDAALTCQAVFSNVTITGNVSGQWAHQDIGILSNAAEPLYVAVSNSSGTPAVVVNNDPAAAQADTWTEWVIPLQAFADQGINLTNVDRIAIGLGTRGNTTIPGGSGKMFFDDIRLYRPREAAQQ